MKTLYPAKPLFLLLMIASSISLAQTTLPLVTTHAQIEPRIPAAIQQQVKANVEQALSRYSLYCTLFDRDAGRVNSKSVNAFIALFDPEKALVCIDYTRDSFPDLVDINDYFIAVLEGPLSLKGLNVSCSDAELLSMYLDSLNPDLIWSTIALTKTFGNYLQDGQQGDYLRPKVRRIQVTFKTYTYFTEETLIREIRFQAPPPPAAISSPEKPEETKTKPSTHPDCNLLTEATIRSREIDEDTALLIEQLICGALKEYTQKATLKDPVTGTITSSSASAFQQLFTSGSSKHTADYLEYPENIEVSEYREDAFKFFRETGLNFPIKDAAIKSIAFDPEGFYFVKVGLKKNMDIYLEAETYHEKKRNRAKDLEMEFSYLIVKRTMKNPLIENVIASMVRKPEAKVTYLTFSAGLSTGLLSTQTTAESSFIGNLISTTSSPSFGIQATLLTNSFARYRSEHKPLFLRLGLELLSYTLEANLSSYTNTRTYTTIDGLPGDEIRILDHLEDRIPIRMIGLPLGVSYRFIHSQKRSMNVFLDVCAVPTYWIQAQPKYSANGFYNLSYPQLGFAVFNENREFEANVDGQEAIEGRYNIGSFSVSDLSSDKIKGKFGLGYRVGLRLQFPLSDRLAGQAGAHFTGYTTPFLEETPAAPSFVFNGKPTPTQVISRKTLFHDYFSSVDLKTLFFQLGIAFSI